MLPGGRGGGSLILDACCVINLFATGRVEEILLSIGYRCLVAEHVATKEALGLTGVGDDSREREAIDLLPLVAASLLEVSTPGSMEEKTLFVRYAAVLDDGEAWTCALAKTMAATVATDDRKALRLLDREGIETLHTPQLLRRWAEETGAPRQTIREALEHVQKKASFRPRTSAPEAKWWRLHVGE